MKITTRIRTALDALTSSLALTVIENTHGIKMIEALSEEQFQTDLTKISSSPERRQAIRDAALTLGRLGISGYDEVADMLQGYHVMRAYELSVGDLRALGNIKAGRRLA